jgi:hypothetical protein
VVRELPGIGQTPVSFIPFGKKREKWWYLRWRLGIKISNRKDAKLLKRSLIYEVINV